MRQFKNNNSDTFRSAAKWLRPGVMFVGLDVNHPPPMSKSEIAQGFLPREPSVVGVGGFRTVPIATLVLNFEISSQRPSPTVGAR